MRERGVASRHAITGSVSVEGGEIGTWSYILSPKAQGSRRAGFVMGWSGKRARGVVLRWVLARRQAMVIGAMLMAPAVVLRVGDYPWESPYTDGVALVMGATGAALLLAGLGGRQPDWTDPDEPGTSGDYGDPDNRPAP